MNFDELPNGTVVMHRDGRSITVMQRSVHDGYWYLPGSQLPLKSPHPDSIILFSPDREDQGPTAVVPESNDDAAKWRHDVAEGTGFLMPETGEWADAATIIEAFEELRERSRELFELRQHPAAVPSTDHRIECARCAEVMLRQVPSNGPENEAMEVCGRCAFELFGPSTDHSALLDELRAWDAVAINRHSVSALDSIRRAVAALEGKSKP